MILLAVVNLDRLHFHYRLTHDRLHWAYGVACGEPCQIREHLLLQEAAAAVRGEERRNGHD